MEVEHENKDMLSLPRFQFMAPLRNQESGIRLFDRAMLYDGEYKT